MDLTAYNDWRLVSLSPFPLWALGLLLAAALAGIVFATLSLRSEQRAHRRRILMALRLIAGAALILLLLEPGKRLMQTTRVKNRVAVLVDRSASMGFPSAPGKPTRAEAVQATLERSAGLLKELSDRFTVELYAFDRDVQPLDLTRAKETLEPRGGSTDLATALRHAGAGGGAAAGRKLSGVLLVSDGADNAELNAGLTADVRQALQSLQVPINTVAVGSGGLKDLAIERVAVDDFAFVRNTIDVEATVRIRGFGSTSVPITLKREGQLVASRTVQAEGDGAYKVVFSFAPDQTGHFVYTVEAPVYADEAVPTNNSRSFALKVIRDRVRVLMVVGRPSWDVRFLRGILKQDPNIDLISFFILRGASDEPRAREDELSLIPFPVREIFQEQLRTFDLVIFQNFAHDVRNAYQMSEFLRGMRDYIHEGGAFVMIGGENSFGEGRYDRTELAEALPVEPSGSPANLEPFKARLTREGRQHPVTAVAANAEQSARIWEAMPELAGAHMLRTKPGAQVLLEHPFATVDGRNVPLVAIWEYGRGRSMAIGTDATWHWAYGVAADGGNVRGYDRFWNNAIRWLVRDPDLTPVKVSAEKPGVEPGEPIAAVVSARRQDYSPAAGARIELELIDANENRAVMRETAIAGPEGTARIELMPPGPGAYKLIARAILGEKELGKGEDAVAVRAAGPELADAAPRPQLLKEIASATGGHFSELGDQLPELKLVDPETVEVGRRKDVPIWDKWYFLVLLGCAVGAEWLLRRRWGYA